MNGYLAGFILFIVGVVFGVVFEGYIFCMSCSGSSQSDLNYDGNIDYKTSYVGSNLMEIQEDRNFDGKFDFFFIFHFGSNRPL